MQPLKKISLCQIFYKNPFWEGGRSLEGWLGAVQVRKARQGTLGARTGWLCSSPGGQSIIPPMQKATSLCCVSQNPILGCIWMKPCSAPAFRGLADVWQQRCSKAMLCPACTGGQAACPHSPG